jgi:hypothetical protein
MTKDEALDLAQEALEICEQDGYIPVRLTRDAITAIKQARSAPVQEPVAWRYDLKQTGSFAGVSTEYSRIKLKIGENWTPLYTTPPAAQRPFVGLTDDEILKMAYPIRWQEVDDFEADRAVNFAQIIEAKLKEKNT